MPNTPVPEGFTTAGQLTPGQWIKYNGLVQQVTAVDGSVSRQVTFSTTVNGVTETWPQIGKTTRIELADAPAGQAGDDWVGKGQGIPHPDVAAEVARSVAARKVGGYSDQTRPYPLEVSTPPVGLLPTAATVGTPEAGRAAVEAALERAKAGELGVIGSGGRDSMARIIEDVHASRMPIQQPPLVAPTHPPMSAIGVSTLICDMADAEAAEELDTPAPDINGNTFAAGTEAERRARHLTVGAHKAAGSTVAPSDPGELELVARIHRPVVELSMFRAGGYAIESELGTPRAPETMTLDDYRSALDTIDQTIEADHPEYTLTGPWRLIAWSGLDVIYGRPAKRI